MNSILIAELFGALHTCVEEHIRADRKDDAIALIRRLQKMNDDFAERRERFVPPEPPSRQPYNFTSEN